MKKYYYALIIGTVVIVILLLAVVLFINNKNKDASSTNYTSLSLMNYSEAKKFAIENSDKIANDIVFILNNLEKLTPWYGFNPEEINQDLISNRIRSEIEKSSETNGVFRNYECNYSGYSPIESGEFKGFVSSGLITCHNPKTEKELGSYQLSYHLGIENKIPGSASSMSFDIMFKENKITIYFPANPSPIFKCPNFECFPRTYYE